jgi:hypothetical protein
MSLGDQLSNMDILPGNMQRSMASTPPGGGQSLVSCLCVGRAGTHSTTYLLVIALPYHNPNV